MGFYSIIRSTKWLLTAYPADRYKRLLSASQHWSREEIINFRNEKLRKLILHCYENVPYYRRVMQDKKIVPQDIKVAEDLVRLPVLTKDIIRGHAKELMAANISEMDVTWTKTGGTTGEPMRIGKDKHCRAWSNMCYERGLRWGGESLEPQIRLFGGSLGIDKLSLVNRIGNRFRGDLFIPAFELGADTAISYFDKIQRSKYRFIIGYASAIYRLAVLAEKFNQKIEFTAAFPTAELMLPEWEEAIRTTFSCSVLPYYGCGEVNSLGFSSPDSDGYLIPEEHALIEVYQSEGETELSGEGRFLVTDLDNYAMPIIRYANGDAGKISPSKGHFPFSRIERLDGRYNSLLMTDTGDLISGVIGTHVFRHTTSVQSYRIIQEEPLRVVIKIVPKDDLSEGDTRLILNLFTKHLGRNMEVTIEKVPHLPVPPSGKSVFVINRCLQ